MDIIKKSLTELSSLFQSGKLTSQEITEAFIKAIEEKNKEINAYVYTDFEQARKMAQASDERKKKNQLLSPLDGMPFSLKDVVCTKEAPTTACSKILKDFQSPYDATVWKRLKEAGVVMLGKVNTDEFTMGASTESSCYGVTKNPADLSRVAGGSSGGSAASVSANLCAASIGTDTGGSIRQPASFCGCSGLKVSYGRVSRFGVMPMASSLDTVGPMAKTCEDLALVMNTIAGNDPNDSTTPNHKVPDYVQHLKTTQDLKGITIGIPKEYFVEGTDPEVLEKLEATKEKMKALGATLKEVSLPHTKYAVPTYYIIVSSEVSANMARYDGVRFGQAAKEARNLEEIYVQSRTQGFGDEVKRRIMLGTYTLSAGYYDAYYRKAQKVRTLIKKDFTDVFTHVDALLTPVAPTPAFPIGQNTNDPVKMYLEDIFTAPANLAGICGISIPVGTNTQNLPIGAQILCPAFAEEKALLIGHILQSVQT